MIHYKVFLYALFFALFNGINIQVLAMQEAKGASKNQLRKTIANEEVNQHENNLQVHDPYGELSHFEHEFGVLFFKDDSGTYSSLQSSTSQLTIHQIIDCCGLGQLCMRLLHKSKGD